MVLAPVSPTDVMMSRDEAEITHQRISDRDQRQAQDLRMMHDQEGWKALGYASWEVYMREAFDYSVSYLSRLNSQMQINHELESNLPERQTRALKKLNTSDRQQAYSIAQELAQAKNEDIKLSDIETAVKQVEARKRVTSSKHRVVSVMMSSNELSVTDANVMVDALDTLDDKTYAKVISIVAKGVSDPQLILPFANMVNRESITLNRILATGYINDKPIKDASLADLDVEKFISQSERIADAVEKKRQDAIEQGQPVVIAHIITVYENDPERTVKELKKQLPDKDLMRIYGLLFDAYKNTVVIDGDDIVELKTAH